MTVEFLENRIQNLIKQIKSDPNNPQLLGIIKSDLTDIKSKFINAVKKVE